MGTPSRPYFWRAAVIAGSRRVQSATRKAIFLSRKAVLISDRERVSRSLTWQVRHQAAVKSMKTDRPAASWRETSASDHARRSVVRVLGEEVAVVFIRRAGRRKAKRVRVVPRSRRMRGGGKERWAWP